VNREEFKLKWKIDQILAKQYRWREEERPTPSEWALLLAYMDAGILYCRHFIFYWRSPASTFSTPVPDCKPLPYLEGGVKKSPKQSATFLGGTL
jgi:hypothetical protein